MDMYQHAYENYKSACKNFGLELINFNQFVRNLTSEQLDQFCNPSK